MRSQICLVPTLMETISEKRKFYDARNDHNHNLQYSSFSVLQSSQFLSNITEAHINSALVGEYFYNYCVRSAFGAELGLWDE